MVLCIQGDPVSWPSVEKIGVQLTQVDLRAAKGSDSLHLSTEIPPPGDTRWYLFVLRSKVYRWSIHGSIDGFRKNLAAFPARFCGHVWAGFVEPAKPKNLVDSEKQRPCFASGNADDELKWTENSLCTILITLWSVLFFLKVRWSSERSFTSAFESLRGFRQRNHRVSLYSSALRDALHMEIESLLELCVQASWALLWRLPVDVK